MCDLTALSVSEREQRSRLVERLRGAVEGAIELGNGYAFRLRPQALSLTEVAELITLERRCCPLLRFELRIEPREGPLWLELSGDTPCKDFLRSALDL